MKIIQTTVPVESMYMIKSIASLTKIVSNFLKIVGEYCSNNWHYKINVGNLEQKPALNTKMNSVSLRANCNNSTFFV